MLTGTEEQQWGGGSLSGMKEARSAHDGSNPWLSFGSCMPGARREKGRSPGTTVMLACSSELVFSLP